jgi:hypothetical protein
MLNSLLRLAALDIDAVAIVRSAGLRQATPLAARRHAFLVTPRRLSLLFGF